MSVGKITQMDDPDGPSDLLFAWLSPIETAVDQRMQRPRSPGLGSPLVRARTAITGFKRTFSGGQSRQDYRQKGRRVSSEHVTIEGEIIDVMLGLRASRTRASHRRASMHEIENFYTESAAVDLLV